MGPWLTQKRGLRRSRIFRGSGDGGGGGQLPIDTVLIVFGVVVVVFLAYGLYKWQREKTRDSDISVETVVPVRDERFESDSKIQN
jgi:hypothetical protein